MPYSLLTDKSLLAGLFKTQCVFSFKSLALQSLFKNDISFYSKFSLLPPLICTYSFKASL